VALDLKRLVPPRTEDATQARYNVEVASAVSVLQKGALAGAVVLPRTLIDNAETIIQHKLGRKPAGWFASCQEGAGVIYQTRDPDEHYIYLRGSIGVYCKPVVY
jgi:hypothetical protein